MTPPPRGTPLSESAAATLAFLQTISDSVACEECIAAYLAVNRYDVLKSIRELILAGRISCTYAACAICRERRLGAQVRRRARSAASNNH